MKYEIQILSGRRITHSWTVTARDGSEADKKSERKRRLLGAVRYRVRKVTPGGLRHGGYHQTAHVFKNHYRPF